MIIECPTCKTKFSIDDNKIRRKTVKLKCSKCGQIFTPSTEPPPRIEEPLEDILKEKQSPLEESQSDNEFPQKSAEEGQPMDDELKSAIDEALKEFKLTDSTGSGASFPDVDFGETVKPESDILGDANFSVREETSKKVDEFVSSGFELKAEEILGTSTPETPPIEGFESTKIESSPPESATPSAEPDLIGDLELELGDGSSTAKAEEESLPEIKEDDFGLETPSRTVTPVPSAPAFPKTPAPTVTRQAPAIKQVTVGAERVSSRSILSYIFFFLIVAASVGLGFRFRNELLSLFNNNSVDQNFTKAFTVVSSRYNFIQNIRGQTLFIVEGRAKNASTKVQNFLKLKVTLKDIDGKDIAEKEFYAGNIVSEESLRTDPAPDVESRFENRVGDALANMNIKPQDEVPFMVVFYDVPNVTSFSIEVLSSEEIH